LKIDVIIPTFNRAHLIKRSVDSVLNQTYQNFHLYIVDDGSTDETLEQLSTYEKHEQITILSQDNLGVSAARNAGARKSSSPWISFLDSDDEWFPEKLQVQVEFLKQNPNIRFVHAEEVWIRNGVRVNPKLKHNKQSENIFERSLEFCLISPSTVLLKRELYFEHHGFNEEFPVCEDFDLWNKILAIECIGFIDRFLINKYGGHEDQLSTKFVAMDFWRIKSLLELAKNHPNKQPIIHPVIIQKSARLLKGYLKHQQLAKHDELTRMLSLGKIS
jgi:glycosyltransferase involved in cell wall biosynthesis